MNRIVKILLIASVVAIASCHWDDEGQTKKEELKKIILDYYTALANKDIHKANSLTTTNFLLWDDGLVYNNKIAIDSVQAMKPFTATFSIDSLNVHVDKRDASAYYHRDAVFTFKDRVIRPRFLESCTFNKEDGRWKLRFMHCSPRK